MAVLLGPSSTGPARSSSVAPAAGAAPTARTVPRVLLLGDSVLDQLGAPAGGTLRRLGATVVVDGVWGSSLLTRDQYDFGQPNPDGVGGSWFQRADAEVAAFHPTVVAVSLNHNYGQPWPRDAAGHEITDTASASFETMVRQQLRLFVHHLARGGATVVLVAPPPHDPAATLPVWDVYREVAASDGIPIVDVSSSLTAADGRYEPERPDCDGVPQAVHSDGPHLTPWASSVMGTALGGALAAVAGLAVDPGDPALDPCAPPADGWTTAAGSAKTTAGSR